jgi:hypothetical protein
VAAQILEANSGIAPMWNCKEMPIIHEMMRYKFHHHRESNFIIKQEEISS